MPNLRLPRITLVLRWRGPSGSVRVTTEMARQLKKAGHEVRVAYKSFPPLSFSYFDSVIRKTWHRIAGGEVDDWIDEFHGEKEAYRSLDDLEFRPKEIVIAVGEHPVLEVNKLQRDVVKIRYCHGFFDDWVEMNKQVWGIPMLTLSVSPVLVPKLEKEYGAKVIGIVPNGINNHEYYLEDRNRDGVGLIFQRIPVKGPEVALELLRRTHQELPAVPWHMFGTSRPQKEFKPGEYRFYPSVSAAREIYNQCKIWIVTSKSEGFCLPTLEAMACGCAVISSDHRNSREMIEDGVNGFVVPYGDVPAYIQKIRFLLENENERQKLVKAGFETVRRYTWDQSVAKMEQALATAIQMTL